MQACMCKCVGFVECIMALSGVPKVLLVTPQTASERSHSQSLTAGFSGAPSLSRPSFPSSPTGSARCRRPHITASEALAEACVREAALLPIATRAFAASLARLGAITLSRPRRCRLLTMAWCRSLSPRAPMSACKACSTSEGACSRAPGQSRRLVVQEDTARCGVCRVQKARGVVDGRGVLDRRRIRLLARDDASVHGDRRIRFQPPLAGPALCRGARRSSLHLIRWSDSAQLKLMLLPRCSPLL